MPIQAEQVGHCDLVGGGPTSLHSHTGGGGISYTEKWSLITIPAIDSWQNCDLSGDGVPPGAICEVLIQNTKANVENTGGIRTVGSGLSRRVTLHEAEAGGATFVTWHVVADNDSCIECWSSDLTDLKLRLLGYWS